MKLPLLLLSGVTFVAAVTASNAEVSQQTLDNLNTAFQGESNAAQRYTAFAKKADQDGYSQPARLFRAAARAEAIHAENHKQAIIALGGKVKEFKLDEPKLGTTAENLQAAIKGENYERETMYPEFIKQARTASATEATRTFLYASKAEAEHAKLYRQVLEELDQKKDAPIYVCKVCGFTTTTLPQRNCISCRESANQYVRVD